MGSIHSTNALRSTNTPLDSSRQQRLCFWALESEERSDLGTVWRVFASLRKHSTYWVMRNSHGNLQFLQIKEMFKVRSVWVAWAWGVWEVHISLQFLGENIHLCLSVIKWLIHRFSSKQIRLNYFSWFPSFLALSDKEKNISGNSAEIAGGRGFRLFSTLEVIYYSLNKDI